MCRSPGPISGKRVVGWVGFGVAKVRAWVQGEPRACEFGVIDLAMPELALVMRAVTECVGPLAPFLANLFVKNT